MSKQTEFISFKSRDELIKILVEKVPYIDNYMSSRKIKDQISQGKLMKRIQKQSKYFSYERGAELRVERNSRKSDMTDPIMYITFDEIDNKTNVKVIVKPNSNYKKIVIGTWLVYLIYDVIVSLKNIGYINIVSVLGMMTIFSVLYLIGFIIEIFKKRKMYNVLMKIWDFDDNAII